MRARTSHADNMVGVLEDLDDLKLVLREDLRSAGRPGAIRCWAVCRMCCMCACGVVGPSRVLWSHRGIRGVRSCTAVSGTFALHTPLPAREACSVKRAARKVSSRKVLLVRHQCFL